MDERQQREKAIRKYEKHIWILQSLLEQELQNEAFSAIFYLTLPYPSMNMSLLRAKAESLHGRGALSELCSHFITPIMAPLSIASRTLFHTTHANKTNGTIKMTDWTNRGRESVKALNP